MEDVGPDLSHLTPEERSIIESVMMRQKQEEQREQEILRRKADEVQILEDSIRVRNEQQKKAGVELDATCHICLKTKFADGVGHICNYCGIRCCARCGGKVTLRSNKVIWICILCRKKQELLSKTGQWMVGAAPTDKRPKLERAHSAAEKENQPLQRSGSALRRQYSEQQEPRAPSCERYQQYNEEDPRFYQGELEGLMRTHPHLVPRRYPDPEPDLVHMDHSQQRVQTATSANKKHKRSGSAKKQHQPQPPPQPQVQLHSYSSSEEDLKSTPEYGSDERDSEKGCADALDGWPPPLGRYIVAPSHHPPHPHPHRPLQDVTADNIRGLTERRKKTVRFDAGGSRQGSQDSHRDSGIDTSSTFTSSEDSTTRGDAPKHPLSWQVSSDGSRMIGHMILRRNSRDAQGSSAAILGLKIVGGKILEDGMTGAMIEKVKKGSIADIEGQLKPGDEVIEWNGRSLQGKTYQEVADIIAESRQEANVELIVSRSMGNRRIAQANWRHSAAQRGHHAVVPPSGPPWPGPDPHQEAYERPHVLVTSPGSSPPDRPEAAARSCVGGRVQLRLEFDASALQLLVTVVRAAGLTPRSPQLQRNPYCKLFLLPDRSEKSKRRTRTLAGTTEPIWNQTFIYSGLRRTDLRLRALELTVWDYVRYGANDFLGEAVVELWPLEELPLWRVLGPHEEVALTPSEHLSPPSTGSRFSDSDTPSECDIDGGRDKRNADGASISSVGSSASPPRESNRRSRRDNDIQPYQGYNTNNNRKGFTSGQRSHSAAPGDSASERERASRSRSKSPRRAASDHRSLSPPDHAPAANQAARFQSRSATATPTGSPKKRQLPQVPHALARALQERVAQDLEGGGGGRARGMGRYVHTYRSTGYGWERRYSGLSDSDLSNHSRTMRRSFSPPDRERDRDPLGLVDFDSDMESVASVTSSAFSTQSERPRGSRPNKKNCQHANANFTNALPPQLSNKSSCFGRSINSSSTPIQITPKQPVVFTKCSSINARLSLDDTSFASSEYSGYPSYRNSRSAREREQDIREPYSLDSPHGYHRLNHHHHHHHRYRDGSVKREQFTRSLSNTEPPNEEKTDGSLSDTAVGHMQGLQDISQKESKGRSEHSRDRERDRQNQFGGLNKKSSSTSQLSATDNKEGRPRGRQVVPIFEVNRRWPAIRIPRRPRPWPTSGPAGFGRARSGRHPALHALPEGLPRGRSDKGQRSAGQGRIQSTASSLCKSIPCEWKKVYGESKNCYCQTDSRPSIPANIGVQRKFTKLYSTGDGLGRLRSHRGQKGVHGGSPNHPGRPQPQQYRHRLVQTVRNDHPVRKSFAFVFLLDRKRRIA